MDSELQARKHQLLNFMHCSGFDWICDIDYRNGQELVASKGSDGTFWWRPVSVEGSGFTRLFKGSIKSIFKNIDLS